MRSEGSRAGLIIGILLLVIGVLVLFLVYLFVVKPQITGYVVDRQIEAYNIAQTDFLNNMLTQLQQTGYIQIPVGNQTLVLAPVQTQQPQQ